LHGGLVRILTSRLQCPLGLVDGGARCVRPPEGVGAALLRVLGRDRVQPGAGLVGSGGVPERVRVR
jgi:hypothetical protein